MKDLIPTEQIERTIFLIRAPNVLSARGAVQRSVYAAGACERLRAPLATKKDLEKRRGGLERGEKPHDDHIQPLLGPTPPLRPPAPPSPRRIFPLPARRP